jgi:hypothetical protein
LRGKLAAYYDSAVVGFDVDSLGSWDAEHLEEGPNSVF